jgi:RNA polymerase sigma factor (sigma-70 family)
MNPLETASTTPLLLLPERAERLSIEAVYRLHSHSVLRRARQMLGVESAAEDVVHEVFASLLERPEQFAGRSKVLTWLYSATTHACLNRLRNDATRRSLLER